VQYGNTFGGEFFNGELTGCRHFIFSVKVEQNDINCIGLNQ